MNSPPKKLVRAKRTHPFIWCLAIICTLICIAVIITGIAVFIGYMVIHPRIPILSVANATLGTMRYSQSGLLETQMTIIIRAENDNTKAHASFSDTAFILSFQGLVIAKLVADPFDVKKNSSIYFNYEVTSDEIPLDSTRMHQVDLSLKRKVIIFDFKGNSRTQWRVWLLGSVKFWCHLNCQLRFHTSNGTYISSRCSSKSK
ncbi:NDR1/HIN1-like protein 12 [Quercus suber]|nr:NDR1/HIN1-like protein 12 [Quercus suber]